MNHFSIACLTIFTHGKNVKEFLHSLPERNCELRPVGIVRRLSIRRTAVKASQLRKPHTNRHCHIYRRGRRHFSFLIQ